MRWQSVSVPNWVSSSHLLASLRLQDEALSAEKSAAHWGRQRCLACLLSHVRRKHAAAQSCGSRRISKTEVQQPYHFGAIRFHNGGGAMTQVREGLVRCCQVSRWRRPEPLKAPRALRRLCQGWAHCSWPAQHFPVHPEPAQPRQDAWALLSSDVLWSPAALHAAALGTAIGTQSQRCPAMQSSLGRMKLTAVAKSVDASWTRYQMMCWLPRGMPGKPSVLGSGPLLLLGSKQWE